MKKYLSVIIFLSPVFLSSTCKKDYYTGTENVRLKANINNTNEAIFLGDTIKINLTIPNTVTSESGQNNVVSSIQKGMYTFVFYQLDTITRSVKRIRDNASISVNKGSLDSYLATVYVTTGTAPFQSILNIVPPAKGVYYVQITNSGSIKINNDYEAFLKVNFNVPDKHWTMYNNYAPGFISSGVNELDTQGYGWYCFKVI